MAAFQKVDYGVKPTGALCAVPDNFKAKLMYYINCMKTVLELDQEVIAALSRYQNYQNLNFEGCKLLLVMCKLLDPSELEGQVIFQNDSMCKDRGNEFYELSQVKRTLGVVNSVVIAGEQRQVKKIMCYKRVWLLRNYHQPLAELEQDIAAEIQARRLVQAAAQSGACAVM